MRAEPKAPRDGSCVVCGKQRDIKARAALDPKLYVDPFCSTTCARAYFGTEDKKIVHGWERKQRQPAYDSCPDCGERKKRESKRCSVCSRKVAREQVRCPVVERTCDQCGQTYSTWRARQRFCSRTCANRHWHLKRKLDVVR